MPFDAYLIPVAAIVAIAFTAEAATGFGAMLIAVSLGVQLYPIKTLLGVFVPLNVLLQTYIVTRHHSHIARRLVMRRILPFMGTGFVLGLLVFERVPGTTLETVFGAFVVCVALRELFQRLRNGGEHLRTVSATTQRVSLVGAGICHGVFAAGGPLLVYALGRSALSKRRFRSTLATVWLTLNLSLTVVYAANGRIGLRIVPLLFALLPAAVLGIAAGEWVHDRLDESRFRLVIFLLLAMAGVLILV